MTEGLLREKIVHGALNRGLRDSRMFKVTSFAVLAIGLFATPCAALAESAYRPVQTVTFAGGALQILEDRRLTPSLARKLWETAVDPVIVLGEDNPAAQPFKKEPLRPARLRQVSKTGVLVVDVVLDKQSPIARIERRRLGRASDPVYLITTDNSAGFGSYSGQVTALYTLSGDRLVPVQAIGPKGRAEKIGLADTLKSGWKVIDNNPSHTVIEQVLCRPDLSERHPDQDQPFQVIYITYQFDGTSWRMAERITSGFWESDDAWPRGSDFPKPGSE